MAGLVPARRVYLTRRSWKNATRQPALLCIHVFPYGISAKKDVDYRDKPGDDADYVDALRYIAG
jgi:hypothetical protein